jgi:hypothetical protein
LNDYKSKTNKTVCQASCRRYVIKTLAAYAKMEYPEFKKNQYGNQYRFLETIGNKEYWQVGDFVYSCFLEAEHCEDSWPLDTKDECAFEKWEEIRSYRIKRISQLPFKEYKFPCLCSASIYQSKIIVHNYTFFSVAEILDNSDIVGLYVRQEEFNSESNYCHIYAEHGTGLACCRAYIRKALLNDFSTGNIDKYISLSKRSIPDFMVQFMIDFLNDDNTLRYFDYGAETVEWLKRLGYDTSEIIKAEESRKARIEQQRMEERAEIRAKELAEKEKTAQERVQSLITVRDLLTNDKPCLFSDIPFGVESLVSLIEKHVGKVPLRTKGWIYNNLYSVTGEDYRYTNGDSKTFSKLMYALRNALKKNKQ